MIVKLTPPQIMQGAFVGVMRQVSNLKRARKPRYGADAEPDWQLHCEGALGEMALALHLNCFWDGAVNNLLAHGWPAAARTRSQDWHDLIIHPDDSDSDAFYLLTGQNGIYNIRGWIFGRDGKRDEWWKGPSMPAFFVPQSALRSPNEWPE